MTVSTRVKVATGWRISISLAIALVGALLLAMAGSGAFSSRAAEATGTDPGALRSGFEDTDLAANF